MRAGKPDPRLIALLVKAQRWSAFLRSGDRPSVLSVCALLLGREQVATQRAARSLVGLDTDESGKRIT